MGCPFDASTGSATAGSGDAVLPSWTSQASRARARQAQGPRRGLRDRGKEAQGPQALGGWDLSDGQKKRPGVLNLGPLMIITVLRVCPFPSASKDFLWYKVVIGLVFHG